MKRTNLVLDERLLEDAKAASGNRTYSATVNQALKELLRGLRAAKADEYANSDVWQGDLGEMRADRVPD